MSIDLKIRQLKKEFAIPENLNHYKPKDYREAERRYILYRQGRLNYNADKEEDHIEYRRLDGLNYDGFE